MSQACTTQGDLFGESAAWVAWQKPSNAGKRAWLAVCEAATEAEAFRKWLGMTRKGNWDCIVLPKGKRP